MGNLAITFPGKRKILLRLLVIFGRRLLQDLGVNLHGSGKLAGRHGTLAIGHQCRDVSGVASSRRGLLRQNLLNRCSIGKFVFLARKTDPCAGETLAQLSELSRCRFGGVKVANAYPIP